MPSGGLPPRGRSIVADRYATALMGLVGSDVAVLNQLDDDLDALGEILATNPKLGAFLENPRIKGADKAALVTKVFGGQVSPRVLNTMLLLIDKHREHELASIASRFTNWRMSVPVVEKRNDPRGRLPAAHLANLRTGPRFTSTGGPDPTVNRQSGGVIRPSGTDLDGTPPNPSEIKGP